MSLLIKSSHLALRFYRNDGWTEELVRSCLLKGDLVFRDDVFSWGDMSYWVGEAGSCFCTESLFSLSGGSVMDYQGNVLSGEVARSYIEMLNW